jgi:hypothetical protein
MMPTGPLTPFRNGPVSEIRGRATDVAREASPWIRSLARAGYAAKGVQYGTIGLLAAMAALGHDGGRTTDSKGALRAIHEQPFGQALLGVMAFGLAGYALWRFVEAVADPEHDGAGAKGVLKRIGRFANGVLHAGLVVYAIDLLSGEALGGSGNGDEAARSWTARLMSWDGGAWLVGAAGVAFFAFAVKEMFTAWTAKLDAQLDLHDMPARTRTWTVHLSRFGIAARALVFALVGVFLVTAAFQTDPSRAKGLGEALGSLRAWTFGGVILGVVAFGLVAYGAYELVEARYRRIQPV